MNDVDEGPQHEAHDLEGRYANFFQVGYNAFEFVLDYGQNYDDGKKSQFHTRIITGPIYAKTLLGLLQTSIEQYERAFGKIKE